MLSWVIFSFWANPTTIKLVWKSNSPSYFTLRRVVITCTCQFAKIDTFEKLFLNPVKVFSSRLRSSSRNSFKIVTRIVRTRSRSYLICPAAVYTPDNVADKHRPIELAFLSVVISIHNFSLIGWKVGMVVTKSRDNEYIM